MKILRTASLGSNYAGYYSPTCLKDHLSKTITSPETTTHKSVQVIFGSIYTEQNDHLSNATNDHFLTVPNILPTRV